MSDFFNDYDAHVAERAKEGIPPLALTKKQTETVVEMLQDGSEKADELLALLRDRVNPGVDPAAQVKAGFLTGIVKGSFTCSLISKEYAIELLGTMIGGYNLQGLVDTLAEGEEKLADLAAKELKNMVLSVNVFDDIKKLSDSGNLFAKEVMNSWANAEWFTNKAPVPTSIKTVIYKVAGEINTDDFSPAPFAFTRDDIPLHANVMGGSVFPNGPKEISDLEAKFKLPVTFVGDVVGTGSSRKSACNSLLWHIGEDIPFVPNKRKGGVIIGDSIAPIFFNTAEDSGALPIETDVSKFETGMVIEVKPLEGKILDDKGAEITSYSLNPPTILDEYRAGGRVPLIIGKMLTTKARAELSMSAIEESKIFSNPRIVAPKSGQGFSLAQKMVGKACGVEGVLPGTACLPKMTTVGSQDTTGPMTASEMTELACLKFNSDFVFQSFCHTAAYPKPTDVTTHATLPDYIRNRGGVSLRPGDGVIHTWLNRLLVPDTVGTGGDSHTRYPMGISFPAGSGLVAFAAALGVMPLDMPESVLVKFSGSLQPGITLRDAVNMIPYAAIQQGLMTVEKKNKKNIFAGRILEMEGIKGLTLEQVFELTDASAERSAAASTYNLDRDMLDEYLLSNIALMESMIDNGFGDADTIRKRITEVKRWMKEETLLKADDNAEYAAVIEINLDDYKEPIVACPNDPDDVKLLSEVAGDVIHEVFVGSCMTNIGHFRALGEVLDGAGQSTPRLWVVPPSKMDADQLAREGYYAKFAAAGARTEIPGCSLCMGNQARVKDGTTVFSTSTRNFNNRMGKGAQVYLGSAELAAVCAMKGKLPTVAEYMEIARPILEKGADKIYKYMNFHQMDNFSIDEKSEQ
jgi:aconitate hydratase 2/2-methylisocitrate dehydratase